MHARRLARVRLIAARVGAAVMVTGALALPATAAVAADSVVLAQDASEEPSEEPSESDGPRDALSGIGGTVVQPTDPDGAGAADGDTRSTAGSSGEEDPRTPEERAGRDSPTGAPAVRTLAAMAVLGTGGLLFSRYRRGHA